MARHQHGVTRRSFLGRTAHGALGGLMALHASRQTVAQNVPALPRLSQGRAALIHGDSRADNVFNALKRIEDQIRKGLAGKKRVVVKPNMVMVNVQLSASHVDCLGAILEFIRPMFKGEIIICDSPAAGRVTEGYDNYGYYALQNKYKVKFLDLDAEPTVIRHVSDHRYRPTAVRMSQLLLDPDTYIVSSAILKTHDRAVVTLSLKNIVVGAAKKDRGFRWGRDSKGNNDKTFIHGGPKNEAINYNLFQLAKQLHPDLSVIDGFQGMEHNGPCAGTPVDHKIAIASTDWLAADRIGTEVMGFDFAKVGYLTFCARAGMGQADLSKIEVLGEKVAAHVRSYRPHDRVEQQYEWMTRGQA